MVSLTTFACVLFAFTTVYGLDYDECKKYGCAEYKVVAKKNGYEVRAYDAYKMATVKSTGVRGLIANYVNFMTLFKYINGNNKQHQRIHMTAPVVNIVNIDEETKKPVEEEFEMGFFLPKELGAAPEPTKKRINIIDFGPVTVYAVSFTGWACPPVVAAKAQNLHDKLRHDGVEFDESYYFVAEYQHPMKLWNRHNDVFYLSTEDSNRIKQAMQ